MSTYDATDGYLLTRTGPLPGATMTLTYDDYGRVHTFTDADGYTVTAELDALDRITAVIYPNGTSDAITYERLDPVVIRNRLGHQTRIFYDALRRPIALRDPLGGTTTMSWCACGSLEKLTDPAGRTTTWERDVQGRVTRELRADGTTQTLYTYDQTTSRRRTETDPLGQVKTSGFLADGTLHTVIYTNAVVATPTVTYTYDAAYRRLSAMTDAVGTTTFTYKASGSPGAGSLATVDGPFASDTLTFGYDELGRMTSRSLNAIVETRDHDLAGRVTSIVNGLGTFTLTYDGSRRRPTSILYPNAQKTIFTYLGNPADGRLQTIHHTDAADATIARHDYTFDVAGNILTWRWQRGTADIELRSYEYDAADRLRRATVSTVDPVPAILKRYVYTYDAMGNRTSVQIDDAIAKWTYDSLHRATSKSGGGPIEIAGATNEPATVTVQGTPVVSAADNAFRAKAEIGVGTTVVTVAATDASGNATARQYEIDATADSQTYTYDANGNVTQKSDGAVTTTYEWDAEDRLTRVLRNGGEIARYRYDGFGRRVEKVAGGITYLYVTDPGNDESGSPIDPGIYHVVEERLSGGGTILYARNPIRPDEWLGRKNADGSINYFATDHLGSVIHETSSAAAPTLTRTYDPWGNLDQTSAALSGPAFTGREWDADAGLYYFRARWYDSNTARFISADPIRFEGGLNFYAYVENNPINRSDPTGLMSAACLANCIEQWRFSNIYTAAGNVANAIGNKVVGETGRTGIGGVKSHPTTWQHKALPKGGRALGRAAVCLTVFEGFYDIGTIAQCLMYCRNQ